jgi:hypothetical protein
LTLEFGGERTNSTGQRVGEFHLWVLGATWAISEDNRQSACSEQRREAMELGAQLLNGAVVKAADLRSDLSLELLFEHELRLDVTPLRDPDMEEWLLYLGDGTVLTAGPGCTLLRESASVSTPLE